MKTITPHTNGAVVFYGITALHAPVVHRAAPPRLVASACGLPLALTSNHVQHLPLAPTASGCPNCFKKDPAP